jgi:hypothetical protein
MIRHLVCLAIVLLPMRAFPQPMVSSYATQDGRVGTVVIACPSQDGSYTAGPCAMAKPGVVNYASPVASSVPAPNVAVTVFAAGSVTTGCDFVNSGTGVLYLDLTTTAVIGSATSIPLQPGQSFHCPYPPAGAVSAIAAQAQSFVAIRY